MKKMILLLLVSISISASFAAQKEFKREISKDFSVGTNPALSVSNKYGNIRIIEGTENKITFKIEIIGKGTTEELAKKYAESVSINFSQNGDKISAETILKSINCNNCGRSTHYVVVAPKSVIMDLENKYGNIYLENAIKPLNVDLKYGDIQANKLTRANIDIKYGNVNINACEELNMDCSYSKLKFGKIEKLNADSKYDDIQMDEVSVFNLETGYTNVKIGRLNKSFITNDFKYCSLDISEIALGFSKIKVDAAYSNIKLALNNSHSFKAALYTRYGKIKTDKMTFNNVSLKKEDALVGTAGHDSNPGAVVEISLSYGDIIFK